MKELKRLINLPQLIFYGIGTIIGAGIYSIIGAASSEAENYLWISFVLAGFAAFLTVLSYAELASALPRAGAEYQFIKEAFPNWRVLAFMAGYLIALNAAATSATVSLAFAGYLNVFFNISHFITAFILLIICTLVNISGIRQSTWVSIILICIEIIGLLLIIYVGFSAGELEESFKTFPAFDAMPGIFSATAMIFFIYIGFEDIANLSEETIEPTKNVPLALLISVIITSILYFLVAISVTGLSTPQELAESDSPLALAAGKKIPWMGQALSIAALFATSSTALISLISISRLLYGMARDGDMPAILANTLEKQRTPWVAALALFFFACLLLPLGQVKIIASISSASVLLIFIGIQSAIITLRYTKPDLKRGFRVPLSIGRFPLLPLIGIIISLFLLTQFERTVYLVVGIAIILGGVIYALRFKPTVALENN